MYRTANGGGVRPLVAAMPLDQTVIAPQFTAAARPLPPAAALPNEGQFMPSTAQATSNVAVASPVQTIQAMPQLRLQFAEIVYNNIVKVQGETSVEVKLGDSMTRYSIEAFALAPDSLDWQELRPRLILCNQFTES